MKCSNEELSVHLIEMAKHYEHIADDDYDGKKVTVQCSDLYQIGRTYRECSERIRQFESLDASEAHPPFNDVDSNDRRIKESLFLLNQWLSDWGFLPKEKRDISGLGLIEQARNLLSHVD